MSKTNWRCDNCGRDCREHTVYSSGLFGNVKPYTYCSAKCRDEAEERKEAKKEAKAAKKAAKRAAEEEEFESGGGSDSSSSSSGGGFANSLMGNVIAGVVLVLLLIIVIGIIFGKNEDANDPAVMMEKWEEHLEKRRAAFAEGLSEEGVEARGLKNYTWDEWQAKLKPQEKPIVKETKETTSLVQLYREYMNKRRELLSSKSSQTVDEIGYEDLTYDEFKARFKDKDAEAELKKLNARIAELERVGKPNDRQSPVTSAAVPAASGTHPKATVNPRAQVARPRASTTPAAPKVVPDVGNGQQNGIDYKSSKDSKRIAITVQGKGKTKDAAIRSAIRQAVWKTVGTWVDSKSRIQENRDKVVAQVETITEADVPKFEVIDTQEQNGGFVVKVRVSVSKKKIAPKFAKVFPDVFTIE